MKHGEYTRQLGELLTEWFKGRSGIIVYYDHGDSSDPNVCKPTTYFGEFSSASTLANVDLVVVQNDKVKLLCEIEEEGGSPKKIIGDACNLLLAERIRIKDKNYPLDEFHFILSMRLAEKGGGIAKLQALETRIKELVRPERLERKTINFIHASEYDELIDTLKEEICKTIELAHGGGRTSLP